jgi:hypothetical protein
MAILTEEVGEVSRLISRMYGEQSFKESLTNDEKKERLADELADVLWVVQHKEMPVCVQWYVTRGRKMGHKLMIS